MNICHLLDTLSVQIILDLVKSTFHTAIFLFFIFLENPRINFVGYFPIMFLRAWLLSSINTNMVVMLVDQLFNLDAHHEYWINIAIKSGEYSRLEEWSLPVQFFIYINKFNRKKGHCNALATLSHPHPKRKRLINNKSYGVI